MSERSSASDQQPSPHELVEAYWQDHYRKMGIDLATPIGRAAAMASINRTLRRVGRDNSDETIQPQVPDALPERTTQTESNARLLIEVLDYYSQDNMVSGMRRQLHADESEFNERYGEKSKDVFAGAQAKRDMMHFPYEAALDILFKNRQSIPELGVDAAEANDMSTFKTALEALYGGKGEAFQKVRTRMKARLDQQNRGQVTLDAFATNEENK